MIGYVYIVYLKMHTIKSDLWRSLLERQSSKREVVGSSPTVGKNFSCCNSRFQLDSANTNEINRDIHLANTLF